MERRITEEKVTKAIINWLALNDWEIICFDFPQSGTGVSLHLNQTLRTTKNKGTFIPDIVAIKSGIVVFFENKDRFVLTDFIKVQYLKETNDYETAIKNLLKDFEYSQIYYGVGLIFTDKNQIKVNQHLDKVDFVVYYHADTEINAVNDINKIF